MKISLNPMIGILMLNSLLAVILVIMQVQRGQCQQLMYYPVYHREEEADVERTENAQFRILKKQNNDERNKNQMAKKKQTETEQKQ